MQYYLMTKLENDMIESNPVGSQLQGYLGSNVKLNVLVYTSRDKF